MTDYVPLSQDKVVSSGDFLSLLFSARNEMCTKLNGQSNYGCQLIGNWFIMGLSVTFSDTIINKQVVSSRHLLGKASLSSVLLQRKSFNPRFNSSHFSFYFFSCKTRSNSLMKLLRTILRYILIFTYISGVQSIFMLLKHSFANPALVQVRHS